MGLHCCGSGRLPMLRFRLLRSPSEKGRHEREVSRSGCARRWLGSGLISTFLCAHRLDSVLRDLTRLSLQACLPTASVALATAFAQLLRPHNGWFVMFQLSLPGLYVFSVLYTRESISLHATSLLFRESAVSAADPPPCPSQRSRQNRHAGCNCHGRGRGSVQLQVLHLLARLAVN